MRFLGLLLALLVVAGVAMRDEVHLFVDPVGYWIGRLDREDERKPALEALAEMGPGASRAIPRLLAMLKDDDFQVRNTTAQVMGKIGKAALPVVKELVGSPEEKLAEAALTAIQTMGAQGAPAVETIVKKTRKGPGTRREYSIVRVFDALGPPGTLALSGLAGSPDAATASRARELLEQLCLTAQDHLLWAIRNGLEAGTIPVTTDLASIRPRLPREVTTRPTTCPEQPRGEEWYSIQPDQYGSLAKKLPGTRPRLSCRRHGATSEW